MKLADIDVLVAHRAAYNARRVQLSACMSEKNPAIQMGTEYIKDVDILVKVRALIRSEIQIKHDEAKAKLMMLGITEFPE